MKIVRFVGCVLLLACAALLPAWLKGTPAGRGVRGGWPCYGGGPSRNMVNTISRNLPTEWETRKDQKRQNVKWTAKLGSVTYGQPVVFGGKVFIGTNNGSPRNPRDVDPLKINPATKKPVPLDKSVLMCFDEATGKFLWQHVNNKLPSGQVHDWPQQGIPSTPIVEGNRLWYTTNRCTVVCLDAEGFANGNQGFQDEHFNDPIDADVIWEFDMFHGLGVHPHNMSNCSPMIAGDIVFVVTSNGVDEGHVNLPAPNAPSFIALDKNTGNLLWSDNSPGRNIMHGQWGSPTYGEIGGQPQVIFPGGDGWLYAFEPKAGKLLWKFDGNPKKAKRYELGGKGERSDFIATPVIYEGKIYIGMGQDPEHYTGVGHLYCIDPAGKTGDISPELVVKDDPDFTKRQTKPNPNSGQVWHYGGIDKNPNARREFIFGRTMSTCAVHDGLVYVAELAGYLHCLDAQTGKAYWQHDLRSAIWSSPYWVDGKVYLGSEDGDVFVFAHGAQMKLLSTIEMEQPIRGPVTAAYGVLYIATETNLYAIEKK